MKNVHILPTDKPSRLRIGDNRNFVFGLMQSAIVSKNDSFTNQHIYITSDEEIKDVRPHKGKWQLEKGQILNKFPNYLTDLSECKLVILTTDQDLIKDGVQAIDDTFLEWFVKNPSCEEVEVDKNWNYPLDKSWEYKIIIPKEEQCSCKVGEPYNNACCKIHGSIPKKEPEQELEKEMFELEQQLDIPSSMRWYNSKPKQETLEEAAEKYKINIKEAIQFGAKWQQERMYSEEEVIELLNEREDYLGSNPSIFDYLSNKEWFEQFKKKTQ
jgi:hypothetical protein